MKTRCFIMKRPTGIPLIDCHFHLTLTRYMSQFSNAEDVRRVMEACGLDAINVQNITLWYTRNLARNPVSLYTKLENAKKVYSFGGVIFPDPEAPDKHFDYAEQALELLELGFDGIKLFGKPTIRREFGEEFCSPVFYELFDTLEKRGTPVLFHMGDPEEFWDGEKVSDFARKAGWYYGEGGFPSYEKLYEETRAVMERNPRLNIVFPHFFFLSADLARCAQFLDDFPNLKIDITPGTEMYPNFSANAEAARAFFIRYQDRILLGTDNTGVSKESPFDCAAAASAHLEKILAFLTGERCAGFENDTLSGLHLPEDVVRKICHDNFVRFVSPAPKAVDRVGAARYTARMIERARARGDHNDVIPELEKTLRAIEG